jgi:diketogulonate reductase-like aldo/keto reductase
MSADTITRRAALTVLAGAAAAMAAPGRAGARQVSMTTRAIPGSGEAIPVIGMGSSGTFDVGDDASAREPLRDVLGVFGDAGGRVIDTSPMYGPAESVLGELIESGALDSTPWLATKVWTRGRDAGAKQIETSMSRLRTQRLDLLQIHNLLDWRTHVPTIRALQDAGKLRYSGITHYRADAHGQLEQVLREQKFDWLQVNYSLAERDAETRLLPFCRDRGIAVMVNRPFADGAMFARVRGRPLPSWVGEIGCESWGQYFLKWVISHPAVTCAIPATSNPRHMRDNCGAGIGRLPDPEQRARMAKDWQAL